MDRGTGQHVVIAGGSGFLGRSLALHLLGAGIPVTILSRKDPRIAGASYQAWDARAVGDWCRVLDGACAVVNLVGRSVDCVKNEANRGVILRSRLDATAALGEGMRRVGAPPRVWVQMSTAHIYGDPTTPCDESSETGNGFAPDVGRAWEAAFDAGRLPGQRGVVLRTSFVLGRDRGSGGGALVTLSRLARLGLGGTVGAGTQGISWIHELDMNRLFERAIADNTMRGTYIASAPNPVTNAEFMRVLRGYAGGLSVVGIPSPAWLVRLGSVVLRTDPELALLGRFVASRRLADVRFEFRFPTLATAFSDLFRR